MPNREIDDISAWLGEDRVAMSIPCLASNYEQDVRAAVVDLSFGGACLKLDPSWDAFELGTLKHLDVDDLGGFDIIYRWRRGDQIGISFRNEEAARPAIQAFFAARGNGPGV